MDLVRIAPRKVPGKAAARARHGPGAIRRKPMDDRGRGSSRGRDPGAPRSDRHHRHRIALPDGRHHWARAGSPADPRRGSGAGPAPRAPGGPGRRLRRIWCLAVATFRRFGSRVTVIERNGALIHREDPDVTEAIERFFRDEGIEVLTRTSVDRVEGRSGESVRLHTGRGVIEGTHLLVAGAARPHRRHRPGEGGGRDGRKRARQGRRAAPDDGRGCLGGGRLRR